MKLKIFSILMALALVLTLGLMAALPVAAQNPPTVTFDTRVTGTAAWSEDQAYAGLRSAKLTTTVGSTDVGMVRFEFAPGELTLDDLTNLSYWEYVSARDTGTSVDVFIDIWLDFNDDGVADANDYPGYIQAEPLYTVGFAPLDTWTGIDAMSLKWSTFVGPDDPYNAPTIYDLQANESTMAAVWTNNVDFGQLDILRIDVRVGYGGTWDNFTGYADDIVINGYTQGFEPLAGVWVDDDFVPGTTGWGYDSFAIIQDGIDAVAEAGIVNVLPGIYNEAPRIDKPLTVRSTDGAAQTIIDGTTTYIVIISHSDVTFDGFTVTNPDYATSGDVSGILVEYVSGDPVSNVYILNNIVTQVRSETGTPSMYGATGINVGNAPLSNIFISGNTITDIRNPGAGASDHTCGINVWDGAVNVVISDNTISDIKYNGIILEHASTVLIEDNSITGCETGLRVEPYEGVSVSDLTVNLNNFANNSSIQVFDGAGVLVIEDVLANNTFDRAVTVDHDGASLLHTIWSIIQGGIDAAQTGDTVIVAAGIYQEGDIRINESVTIQGAGRSDTIIDATGENAGFYIDTDDVTIKDLTVKNSIYRNITVYSTTVSNITIDNVASLDSLASGLEVHHSTVNNLVINICLFSGNGLHGMRVDSAGVVNGMTITGSHFDGNDAGMTIYGDTDNVVILGSTFNNNVAQTGGNWTGGYGLYIGNANGATKTNTGWLIDNCQFKNNHYDHPNYTSGTPTFSCGIALSPYWANSIVSNMKISNTEFSGNQEIGFKASSVSATDISSVTIEYCDFIGMAYGIKITGEGITDFQVHYCNFDGNSEYGIYNSSPIIDALNNWWGDKSGPSHSPGYGDPISGNVLYNPWLLEPLVPGAPLPTTYDQTLALNIGWTLVSTDNWINTTETVGLGVTLAYKYIPGTPSGSWVEVDPTALVPVDALYLKTTEGGVLGITYLGGAPAPSSKILVAGWNLISSATIDNANAVLSPLRYVVIGDQQLFGLTTLVSQGNFNQHSLSFYLSTLGDADWDALALEDLNPFDGYWVYMNADKVFGVVPN